MRRFWMLLLAVMALAALLAVPAMAEEQTHLHGSCTTGTACAVCDHDHTGWETLPADKTTISASGNYFLNADSVAAGITVTGDIEVTICLNGKVWTNPDSATRPLYVKDGAKVNIVDCSNQSAISETDSTPVSGGSIQSTVDRSAESTGAEGYRTNTMGGAIYVSGKSELNIYNGTIDGGYVYSGGTIYTTNSTVNIYGGHITGGRARTGGNIYMASGTLTVDGVNAVISAGTTTKKVSIENSDTEAKEEYDPNGGNVYTAGGTMYLKAGVIRDGAAMGTAGNVRIGGVFNMSGGTIIGGIKITNEDTGTYNTTDGSANMQFVGAKSHVLSGGTITGHVTTYKTVMFTVSGDMVFAEVDEADVIGGLGLQGNNVGDTKIVIGEGGLGDNALIAVYKTTGWAVVDKTADEAQWNTIKGYLTSGKLRGFNNYKLTLEAADAEAEKAEAIYARSTTADTRYSCLCGHNPGEEHIGECDGYAVPWTAWKLTGSNALPTSVGHYYLVDNDGTADNTVNASRGDITNRNGIYVDFNGVKVTRNTSARFGNIYCSSTTAPTVVTYIDSSLGHTGELITDCPTATDHSNIWICMSEVTDTKESQPSTLNCYRLTMDCSPITKTSGAGLVVGAGGFLNLYECHVTGGTTSSGAASAVYNQGGTVNIVGGSITGGTAKTTGGAICNVDYTFNYKVDGVVKLTRLYKASMALTNVTINGGTAGTNGGAIYNSSTMTLTDVNITGGTATTSGGSIYNEKTMSLTGVEVDGGHAGTSGGAIYTKGGALTVTDSTISGGTADSNGGVLIIVNNSATFSNSTITAETEGTAASKGAVFYVHGGTLTVKNGTTITGGTATNGGAVYMAGGTFNLYDGTISGGHAADGGNVYMNGSAAVFNAIPDPKGAAASAVRTIEGGAAESATAHGRGGNFYVYAGTVNLDGATVADGTARYEGTVKDKRGYGGNFYLDTANTTLNVDNSTIEGGTVYTLYNGGNAWAPGGNIYMGTYCTLDVENSTITDGQRHATGDSSSVDAKNIYINYDCTVHLRTGTVVSNTNTVNKQESILVQGGTLNIYDGCSITTADGVTGRNIYCNSSAYSNSYTTRAPVINMYGGTISGGNSNLGGNVYLHNLALLNMEGGTIQNGTATSQGGNVYLDNLAQFNMEGGTIQNGTATNNGGNIYAKVLKDDDAFITEHNTKVDPDGTAEDLTAVDIAAKVNISGTAKIIGGKNTGTEKNGGSIFMGTGTTLTVDGNAEIYGGSATNCGGNIYSNGYVTLGGNAKIYDGVSGSTPENVFVVDGDLTLADNVQIAGGVCSTQTTGTAGTVTLKGSPVVDKALTSSTVEAPSYSLRLGAEGTTAGEGNLLVLDGLTAAADVKLQFAKISKVYVVDEATKGYIVSSNAVGDNNYTGLTYETGAYYFQTNEDDRLVIVAAADVVGVAVNKGSAVYSLEEAIAMAGADGYIRLINHLADATISTSTRLDLDGYSLTNLTLASGVELQLFDSATADYAVEAVTDEDGNVTGYTGYGTVTLAAGSEGKILRTMNTPKATYGHNYRYVVVKEGDAYSAHRIYLTVKSTILYPNKPALNYRTALRCDQVVAKYINAEGGGFGVLTSSQNSAGEATVAYGDYTDKGHYALTWDSETTEENNRITQLNEILKEGAEDNEFRAGSTVKAQAYIYLADDFYDGKLTENADDAARAANAALIAQNAITSSGVNQSLKNMVLIANAKSPDDLTTIQKDALGNMYTHWEALMSTWSVKQLADYTRSDLKYGCLCGDPDSTGNPCAENGHARLTWRAWTDDSGNAITNRFPSESGNYYLLEDVVLTAQGRVNGDVFINLNTMGKHISVEANRRVANVYGVLNLTNFGYDGAEVVESVVQATGPQNTEANGGGNGGVLLVLNTDEGHGNVSLYSNVLIKAQDGHNITNGVVEVGGDLNIYGGKIEGAVLKDKKTMKNGSESDIDSRGGAVSVTAEGYFYMNAGTITGGTAEQGGAVYTKGTVELAGGTITGGTALSSDTTAGDTGYGGGMFYVNGGTVKNKGMDLDASGSQAPRGALMYVASGTVQMYGTAEEKLQLTGGNVVANIETDSTGASTDDALKYSGSGGVFYVAGGEVQLDHCVVNSGDTKQIKLVDGTFGEYTDDLDDHGGMAFFLTGSGQAVVENSTIHGRRDADADYVVCKRGGTIYMVGSSSMTVENTTVTATYCNVNGPVLHMEGGTFTMNTGAELNATDLFYGESAKYANGITYGGTVSLANTNATFYMNDGLITGGVAKNAAKYGGGNVSISSGSFYMYGGSITNGKRLGSSTENGGGGNVRMAGGSFTMTGGQITGGVSENGCGGGILVAGGTLNISGNARIIGNTTDGTNANNVYLTDGKTITLGTLETANTVSPSIGVTLATVGGYVTEGNTANLSALNNGWLASDKALTMGQETGETKDFYIGKFGCVCGAYGSEKHMDECNEESVLWYPWTDTAHLPDVAGYWYLAYEADEVTVSEQASIGYNSTTNVDVYVDLNGKTVTRATANDDSNNRFFALRETSTEGVAHSLTITDSSVGHSGKLICAETSQKQGMGVYIAQAGHTLNIYRGIIDASNSTQTAYSGVVINANGDVNMYGGKLIGGTTYKDGGTVYLGSGATFTMTDGEIVGGQALCTQADAGEDTKVVDGKTITYTKYTCSDHGAGGAVYIAANATFHMNGGSVVAPERTDDNHFRGAGNGGLLCVDGTLNLTKGTVSGGSVDGAGAVNGAGGQVRHDCGYGGNIYVSGSGTLNMSGGSVSGGYATSAYLADGTYVADGETVAISDYATAGGGLGGNICVSGTLNLTGGTVESGIAGNGGNIGTNNAGANITLGVPEGTEGDVNEKTVQILNGTADTGGNIAINVRPCESFNINQGTWIEGGQAFNGGSIAITPWAINVGQYKKDADGNYETLYEALITVNGGTITGGIAEHLGGNVYLYGQPYTNDNTAYPKVEVHASLALGEAAVISDGASANGNNLYLNSYGDAVISGTVRNTLEKGTYNQGADNQYTVSLNSVYIGTVNSKLTLEATGSIVNEKPSEDGVLPVMRNVYANSGNFYMNGGTIANGYLTGSGDHGANLYVNTANAKVYMAGGVIKDGMCDVSLDTSKDKTVKEHIYSGSGGNVFISAGHMELSGNALITGGKAASGGGNVYMVKDQSSTLTMKDSASITNGLSAKNNGGNVFVGNKATFNMEGGTISGGKTADGGGNLYFNGTFNMKGGTLKEGLAGLKWTDFSQALVTDPIANDSYSTKVNACVFIVGGQFNMSGGEIDTGVGSTNTAATAKTIVLSGTPKIGGTGLNLSAIKNDKTTEDTTDYYPINAVDATGLTAGAEIHITSDRLAEQTDNRWKLTVETGDPAYTAKLFKESLPDTCQVAYLSDGVYLYNGATHRFHCLCGVNDDEVTTKGHLPGCNGTELEWHAWTDKSMPNVPGNWFLYYGTDKSKTVSMKTGDMKFDFYQNDAGEWVKVRALLALDEYGAFITMGDGSFKQAVDASGNPIWLNSDATAIDTNANGKVKPSYTVNVDLNGYKMEAPSNNRNLTFYGRNEFEATVLRTELQTTLADFLYDKDDTDAVDMRFSTHRQTPVEYTIVDASQDHTAVMAAYGTFTNNVRTNNGQPQGTNIWMYWQEDTLNTYRTTIDASNAKFGWGMALTVHGTANLYDTTVIGGVAQGYFSKNETVTAEDGSSGTVQTVGGSSVGGGAIHVTDTGTVNMYGGTIKDGTAVYRYMDGTNGVDVERAIGGGNVFVNGTFNVEGTATYPASITGGKALYYQGADEVNSLSYNATAQGGGVYLCEGTMTVKGNVSITGNHCGTVTGTVDETNGTGSGIVTFTSKGITANTANNVFLNGNTMEVSGLTGTVGFTMNGDTWEGAFAKVDTDDDSYVTSGKLSPDVTQTNSVQCGDDGILRYVANNTTLQVGFGSASIYPTKEDITNGLSLGGYGNNSYSSSKENARITRYWTNTATTVSMPATLEGYDSTEMMATAMAFRDTEGDTVIIINVDYNNIDATVGKNVKRLVSKATGVPMDNITISASHQHTGPGIGKVYWTDLEGNYTKEPDTDRTSSGTGTYASQLYSGEPLKEWEPRVVRTDYATTFYTNVQAAAVEAYKDLADVTSVTAGVMDTTTGGNQFNFVRNVALYTAADSTTVAGMITDNHRTVSEADESSYIKKYESEVDVTMQLVKYQRADKTIVLANFQSHPHVGSGNNNLNPTGDVVGAFREELRRLNADMDVIYFSGAGGNVNSSTSVAGYTGKLPWAGKTLSTDAIEKRAQIVRYHGNALAALANEFLNDPTKMDVTVAAKTADVQVSVQEFEYDVWDESATYSQVGPTLTTTKLANAKKLIDWETGSYLARPSDFGESINYPGTSTSYWDYFVGNQTGNDRIYSFFHANGVRKRLLRKQADNMTGTFEITAYDLGGIGFIAAPYEMFQENGQAIKGNTAGIVGVDYTTVASGVGVGDSSPYDITIIASQANGANGYIPSTIGYINGGYSTDTSLYAPGTGEKLVQTYVDMLHALKGE